MIVKINTLARDDFKNNRWGQDRETEYEAHTERVQQIKSWLQHHRLMAEVFTEPERLRSDQFTIKVLERWLAVFG